MQAGLEEREKTSHLVCSGPNPAWVIGEGRHLVSSGGG